MSVFVRRTRARTRWGRRHLALLLCSLFTFALLAAPETPAPSVAAPSEAGAQDIPASAQAAPPETTAASRGLPVDTPKRLYVLRIQGGIFAGTSDYLTSNIRRAEAEGVPVLLQLDTPGGALEATRDIVKSFLGARVPIIVWVGPSGARAGSAGTFITMAAHVAAMAPATNIGAAHPIGMGVGAPGDDEEEEVDPSAAPAESRKGKRRAKKGDDEVLAQKVENDTMAFIESIAVARKRNVEWAISAVRDSVSVTAEKALELRVIDLLAGDIDTLLSEIDGRVVETAAGAVTLRTRGAEKIEVPMSLRERLIAFLSDPNLVYILFVVGMLGIYLEMSKPGALVPAIVGGVSLILALTGLSVLPYNATGLIFLVIAGVCFVAEAYVTSFGLLALGGAVSLVLGAVLLFDSAPDPGQVTGFEIAVSPYVYGSVAAFSLALVLPVAWLVARAHAQRPVSGQEGLIGKTGKALTRIDIGSGRAFIHGEYWEARSKSVIETGEDVVVLAIEGLRLEVAPRPSGG